MHGTSVSDLFFRRSSCSCIIKDNSGTHSWFGSILLHDQLTASITEVLVLSLNFRPSHTTALVEIQKHDANRCHGRWRSLLSSGTGWCWPNTSSTSDVLKGFRTCFLLRVSLLCSAPARTAVPLLLCRRNLCRGGSR